jgi:hypothetical protein
MGVDWLYGDLLNDNENGKNLCLKLVRMLNEDRIPDYLKEACPHKQKRKNHRPP